MAELVFRGARPRLEILHITQHHTIQHDTLQPYQYQVDEHYVLLANHQCYVEFF